LSLAYLSSQQADTPDSLIESVTASDLEENVLAPEATNSNSSLEVMPSIEASDISVESEQ